MGTYYHGNSDIQGGTGDGLQTLILMNPGSYVGFSDATQQPTQQHPPPPPPGSSNFVFLNSNNHGTSLHFPHAPPPGNQTQQFVGIPLAASPSPPASSHQDLQAHHDISALHGFIPRVHYNLYNPTVDFTAARDVPRSQQGLSLSLSPQQPAPYNVPSQPLASSISPTGMGDELRGSGGSPSSASGVSNGMTGIQSVLLSSKYLKAAQELLEEVVNVGKGVKVSGESGKGSSSNNGETSKNIGESTSAASGADGQDGRDSGSAKRAAELTTAERQEIQMRKAKLVNMLDEVEQRYRQYHQQMQLVISWFEQAAGIGSAKTYTALALQTISKQFRCLKDAILGQIRAASKSLGEEDSFTGKMEGSRLKFVDNQLRQQRALQQLGMIQHNAWRPQRGLPERSVSVLRAWLFEHFLHPYPKDSDKIMLAKQTGLTRSQVSNWFINARVRLWKPMVEEMYMEEMKEQEKNAPGEKISKSEPNEDSTPSQDRSPGEDNQSKSFMSITNHGNNPNTTPSISMSANTLTTPAISLQNQSGFHLIGSSEMENISQASPKRPRSSDMLNSPTSAPSISMDPKANGEPNEPMAIKFGDEKQSADGFTLMGAPTNFIGGFGSYSMGELGRFGGPYAGNGVSLTLGLPHCENISISGGHQTFLPNQNIQLGRGVEIEANDFSNMTTPSSTHSTNVYDNINIQNRKRFAAQLLPDFVA